jgi:ectoine hydroxylase-related dioxygenase (phytanoyl-CoA dioxygenase family)
MATTETTIIDNDLELQTSGYTVLKSCIDANYTEEAIKELLAEYDSALPLPWTGGGKWFGHVNYIPSPLSQIIKELTSNSRIVKILDHALGEDYKIVGFVGNANLPNSRHQPAHVDGNLGADFLVVNIPLGRVTEHNGSTEVWPGTHRENLKFSEFSALRVQSVRLNSSPGDVVIRYPNLWHRGTPNNSQEVRFMLGIIVSRSYKNFPPVIVSNNEQTELLSLGVSVHANTGTEIKRGFIPNYFKPNLKGNIKELTWLYAPELFKTMQRVKS